MWDKTEYEVPESQFRQRIARAYELASEHYLSAVVVYSAPRIHQWTQTGHVGYLTNWSNLDRITDSMVVVSRDAEPVLLVAGVEYMLDQIREVSWVSDVRLVSSPDPRAVSAAFDPSVGGQEAARGARTFGSEISQILKTKRCADSSIGIAGLDAMPAAIHRDLASCLDGRIADVPDIVSRLRAIKTPQELAILRQVAAISDRCYETMMEVLTDGMWGYELSAEMDRAAKREGADLVYNTVHSAPGGDLSRGKLSIKAHDCRLRIAVITSMSMPMWFTRAIGFNQTGSAPSAQSWDQQPPVQSRPISACRMRSWQRLGRDCPSASWCVSGTRWPNGRATGSRADESVTDRDWIIPSNLFSSQAVAKPSNRATCLSCMSAWSYPARMF